jgi:PAS domain S-box-containing protein
MAISLTEYEGKPAMVGTAFDITDRKGAEAALERSEELYRAVAEGMRDGVSINVNDQRVYVNQAFLDIHGLKDASQAIGKPIDTFYAPEEKRKIATFADLRRVTGFRPRVERRIIRQSGEARTIESVVTPITYLGESARLVVIRDITQRKQADAELETTRANLIQAEKMSAIGQLVAGVAHELNNPLAGVLGFTQLLLRTELPEEVRSDVSAIAKNANRAANIVKQLLSFARNQDAVLAPVELNLILEATVAAKRDDLRTAKIETELDLGADVSLVMADVSQIQSVFLNLIENAQYAMTEANGSGTLSIKVSLRGERVRVSVTDNGTGIKAENLSSIFNPFFTTKGIGMGTGLGLSVCHGIVMGSGGEMWVESEEGKGATFYVELPVIPGSTDADAPVATARPGGNGALVYIVDDESVIREVATRALSRAGYEVESTDSAPAAIIALQNANPDVVLLDMKMPEMSGQELWQVLEASRPDLLAKVIWVTGAAVDPIIEAFIESTGRPVLDKPFNLEDLERVVAEVFDANRAG